MIELSTEDSTNLSMIKQSLPQFNGDIERDRASAVSFFNLSEELLSKFPTKSERNSSQLQECGSIHEICRGVRQNFMQLHSAWLYDKVIQQFSNEKAKLSDIAIAAADLVPGLVPTREQLSEEEQRSQADKEGRELDQGIFFSGMLSDPVIGTKLIEYTSLVTSRALSLLDTFKSENTLSLEKITITRKNQAAYIEFKNSECLNAEDNELIADFETAVDLVLIDPEIKVGVIRGSVVQHPKYKGRRIFSAGINLKHIHQGKISFPDFILGRELGYINKMMRGARLSSESQDKVSKPWLAAVDTFAIGGGMQLLFACDYVLGADDSYVCLPAAKEGIIPGVSNLRLANIAHGRLAQQVILHGKKINAVDEAAKYIYDRVVAPEDMDSAINDGVTILNSQAVITNRKMLFHAREPMESFRDYMAKFSIEQAKRLYSEDVNQKVSKM